MVDFAAESRVYRRSREFLPLVRSITFEQGAVAILILKLACIIINCIGLVFLLTVSVFVCRINVEQGESVEKILATGKHSVRDIFCKVCQQKVGWQYVSVHFLWPASSQSQTRGLRDI